jgi:hypothetical protein
MIQEKFSLDRFPDFADAILNRITALETKLDKKEQERYLTVRQVMDLFNLKSKASIYNWIAAGYLIIHKVGKRTFFKRNEIDVDKLSKYKHN